MRLIKGADTRRGKSECQAVMARIGVQDLPCSERLQICARWGWRLPALSSTKGGLKEIIPEQCSGLVPVIGRPDFIPLAKAFLAFARPVLSWRYFSNA